MIDLPPDQLEQVREIVRRHLRQGEVFAFGSRVSGNAKKFSDLDLMIKANGSLTLTHKDAANHDVKEPLGNWRVISMLSEKPRDFSTAAFGRDGDFLVVERSALETKLAANGLAGLFGTPRCAAGESCPDHFAIGVANIAREAAPPPPAAKRAPAPRTASQNPPRNASPGKKTPDSEREYMKRFNKDLDNLLGK